MSMEGVPQEEVSGESEPMFLGAAEWVQARCLVKIIRCVYIHIVTEGVERSLPKNLM